MLRQKNMSKIHPRISCAQNDDIYTLLLDPVQPPELWFCHYTHIVEDLDETVQQKGKVICV